MAQRGESSISIIKEVRGGREAVGWGCFWTCIGGAQFCADTESSAQSGVRAPRISWGGSKEQCLGGFVKHAPGEGAGVGEPVA